MTTVDLRVPVKGGKTRDIPLPAVVMHYLEGYVEQFLPTEVENVKPDTPLFWSTYGQRRQGLVRRPTEGKNIWRLCKTYGRQIGYPMRPSPTTFAMPRALLQRADHLIE